MGILKSHSAKPVSETLFAHKIQPLFKSKCLACHGEGPNNKIKGDLDMRSLDGLIKGGESGKSSIILGNANKSPLYLAITRVHEDDWSAMPPKEKDKLDKDQIGYVRDWINGGGDWPSEEKIAQILKSPDPWEKGNGVKVMTSGGMDPTWTNRKYEKEDLWAYQNLQKVEVPNGVHPIDYFIENKLPKGLSVAAQSDPTTLIRRVSFSLTGLPPSPKEVEQFIDSWNDNSAEAWSNLVDRLLESPHYGEQMAKHWLDVVRYGDSAGFSNDYPRPHAWRYRDYVVRSFNEDKPYDQFVREQIAGDEINGSDPEHIIATGFLRMGPWEQYRDECQSRDSSTVPR